MQFYKVFLGLIEKPKGPIIQIAALAKAQRL
jgi:hypothetical protein